MIAYLGSSILPAWLEAAKIRASVRSITKSLPGVLALTGYHLYIYMMRPLLTGDAHKAFNTQQGRMDPATSTQREKLAVHDNPSPSRYEFVQGKSRSVQFDSAARYGARFSTEIYTRGVPLSFTPLLRLKRCHACDQWHSSRVSTPLTVTTINFVQTLKAHAQQARGGSLTKQVYVRQPCRLSVQAYLQCHLERRSFNHPGSIEVRSSLGKEVLCA
jgi:hypothetical protein